MSKFSHFKLCQNVPSRARTKLLFFLSDKKICVKHQGNILSFSRQGELYDEQKLALKYLKVALQNKSNMPYCFFCMIARVIPRITLQNLMKTYQIILNK